MIITKDTTLKGLHELQRHCMKQKEEAIDSRLWMCYKCIYRAADIGCNCIDVAGRVPYEWTLPRGESMRITEDTTLDELKVMQSTCISQYRVVEGTKTHPCDGCMFSYLLKIDDYVISEDGEEFYFPHYKPLCEGGNVPPYEWVLPRVDYE